jgi:chemotaxis protein CheD
MRLLPAGCVEIFIGPGEYYFGDHGTRIRTLLGSCVAVTMWHPRQRIGGMCHFLVPARGSEPGEQLDGRYGLEAMGLLIQDAGKANTDPRDYRFKVFGGGNMFPELGDKSGLDVGTKNVECAKKFLGDAGYAIESEHHGGSGARNLIFDIWDGDVWLRHHTIKHSKAVANG